MPASASACIWFTWSSCWRSCAAKSPWAGAADSVARAATARWARVGLVGTLGRASLATRVYHASHALALGTLNSGIPH